MATIPVPRATTVPIPALALVGPLLRSWRYAGGKRDLRLDLLRGFAAFAMIVDHIGGGDSWLYAVTGGNRFFVSAAETFVFISGLTVGVVYGGIVVKEGIGASVVKALRRSWTLYTLAVALTFSFAALSLALALPWAPRLTAATAPAWTLEVITLRRTYFLADIMLLYAVLLFAAAPLLVALVKGHTRWVLGGSWAVWAIWQVAPSQAHLPWAIADNTVFNIAAWQVLFVTALAIGFHRRALERRLARLPIGLILAATGAFLAVAVALLLTQERPGGLLAPGSFLAEQLHGKEDVRFGRLVVFAAFFAFAYSLTTLLWTPLARMLSWLLLPLGQSALTAYTLHLFVTALLAKALPTWTATRSAGENALIQIVGVLLIWGMIVLRPTATAWIRSLVTRLTAPDVARAPAAC